MGLTSLPGSMAAGRGIEIVAACALIEAQLQRYPIRRIGAPLLGRPSSDESLFRIDASSTRDGVSSP